MIIQELRLGNNLYDFNKKIVTVTSISENTVRCSYKRTDTGNIHTSLYNITELYPIILIEEHLNSCSFIKQSNNGLIKNESWNVGGSMFIYADADNEIFSHNLLIGGELKYFHQLQNLYFALTYTELNFKL